jgi:hypothetical protein
MQLSKTTTLLSTVLLTLTNALPNPALLTNPVSESHLPPASDAYHLLNPILPRTGTPAAAYLGQPGMVTGKQFSLTPGAATCHGAAPQGATLRLPKEFMTDYAGKSRCGTQATVFFKPADEDGSHPGYQIATVWGTCVDCQTWEVELDQQTVNLIDNGAGLDWSKGYWGVTVGFGVPT